MMRFCEIRLLKIPKKSRFSYPAGCLAKAATTEVFLAFLFVEVAQKTIVEHFAIVFIRF